MIAQLIQTGVQHHQAGRLQQAESLYQQALQLAPNNPDALHLSGLVAYQSGRLEDAVTLIGKAVSLMPSSSIMYFNLASALKAQGRPDAAIENYRRAIALNPAYAEAHNNLGNLLKQQGRFAEAAASLRQALALRPDYAEGHNNLGIALREQGLPDEAIASYRRAVALKPDYAEAYNNLGNALKDQGRLDEAIECYRRALALRPDYADTYGNLGGVLKTRGKLDEALECFRQQLRLAPDNLVAQHLVASLTGTATERAPAQYVAQLFDDYAEKFDSHLQQSLGYDIPQKMAALVTERFTPQPGQWRVLDLGCGTGLAGQVLAPFARHLAGVDLSAKMLEKARERKLYQRLERADLLTMLQGEPGSSYDVVIAADVFVYLGRLDEVIGEIRRLLGAGGIFAFSAEALQPAPGAESAPALPYRLENTGRYAHAPDYLAGLADANGFIRSAMIDTTIRMEHGKPVPGYLALWQIQHQQNEVLPGSL